jgi:hypothetical protein
MYRQHFPVAFLPGYNISRRSSVVFVIQCKYDRDRNIILSSDEKYLYITALQFVTGPAMLYQYNVRIADFYSTFFRSIKSYTINV